MTNPSNIKSQSLEPDEPVLDESLKRIYRLPRSKQPSWLRKRVDILEDVLTNPVFTNDIEHLKKFNYEKLPVEDKEELIGQLFYKHKIPEDLSPVIMNYILTDEVWISLIYPPVEYISHRYKIKGVTPLPHSMYEVEMFKQKFNAKLKPDDLLDKRLTLFVNDNTTKAELIEFIDDFFDEHLAPAVHNPESKHHYHRKKVKLRKFAKRDKIILELHLQGKTASEISKVLTDTLENEDSPVLDESRINKIIKKLKGRHEIDYTNAEESEELRSKMLKMIRQKYKQDT